MYMHVVCAVSVFVNVNVCTICQTRADIKLWPIGLVRSYKG